MSPILGYRKTTSPLLPLSWSFVVVVINLFLHSKFYSPPGPTPRVPHSITPPTPYTPKLAHLGSQSCSCSHCLSDELHLPSEPQTLQLCHRAVSPAALLQHRNSQEDSDSLEVSLNTANNTNLTSDEGASFSGLQVPHEGVLLLEIWPNAVVPDKYFTKLLCVCMLGGGRYYTLRLLQALWRPWQ